MIKRTSSIIVLLLCVYNLVRTQELYTLSVLTQVPQSSYANPALVPTRLQFFLGVPVLSGIQYNANSQGFTPKELGMTSILNPRIDYQLARQNAGSNNIYRTSGRVDLLYGGIANKSGVFSFNFSERFVGQTAIPMDFFTRLGNEDEQVLSEGISYDLNSLNGEALHFKELGIAYTTQKRKGVNWGVRLKFLLGREGIISENESLKLLEVEGSLSTQGRITFKTAGFEHFSANEKFFQLFSAKNAGVALDAGFHYRYNKKWEFFGSIRDFGGITWRKSLNLREVSDISPDLMSEIDNTFQNLVDERAENPSSFRTSLPTQISGGMRYHLKNKHTLNALASTRFYPSGTDIGLSLAYHIPISPKLEWTASYSIFNQTYTNLGTGNGRASWKSPTVFCVG